MDPSAGPVQQLAYGMRKLRHEAGSPSYREMARRVAYSATGLSRAADGTRLPSLDAVLAYVQACGGNREEWENRWRAVAEEAGQLAARQSAQDEHTVPPYQGLARFEPGDADRFFGRDRLVDDVLALARRSRFVMLVGASGSGKSSLLRAGLIPALSGPAVHERPATIRVLTPGPHPSRSYAPLLVPRKPDGPQPGADTWIIVDQFEEVFTLCHDRDERAEFIGRLLAARESGSRLRVVAAIRSDFYGRCAELPALAAASSEAHLLVGPMTPAELRETIVRPAASHGLIVERALTARIVEEIEGEPGALPLLSHALLETWHRRQGRTLTVAGYEAVGGVHGAIARTAEEIYHELPPEQAVQARRVLLRLVTPGEGTEDTRRSAGRAELEGLTADRADDAGTGGQSDAAAVVARLVRGRLITLDGETVDLAHEALITSWPRLRAWIDEDRERLHRRLTEAAAEWEALGYDPGVLYRGTRLAAAEERFVTAGRSGELIRQEGAFLAAGLAARDEERRLDMRRTRRLRRLVIILAVLLAMVASAGGIALHLRQEAVASGRQALSRQFAAQAMELTVSQPDRAMVLAVEAYHVARTPEARGALLSMATLQHYRTQLPAHTDGLSGVAFGRDGTLATVGREGLRLWDPVRRTRLRGPDGSGSGQSSVSFSPDGRLLATGGDDADIVLWDVERGQRTGVLSGHEDTVRSVSFSPDSRTLASGSVDGTVRLWDINHRRQQVVFRQQGNGPDPGGREVNAVAFSPDGHTVAAVGVDGTVRLWPVRTGRALAEMPGHVGSVDAVAFSPDGRTLATAGQDHTVRLWDVPGRRSKASLRGHGGAVRTLAFSPDGRTFASSGHDATVFLWDLERTAIMAGITGHSADIHTMAFHPDGTLLATGDENGKVILWEPTRIPLSGHSDRLTDVAFSPDGRTLATAGDDRTIVLWDIGRRLPKARLGTLSGPVNAVAFSPDGDTLAAAVGRSGAADHALLLWDTDGNERPRRLVGHSSPVTGVDFSPDGRHIATVGADGKVILWDAGRGTRLAMMNGVARGSAVVFSPDGRLLASAHPDGATLWTVSEHPRSTTLRGHNGPVSALAFSPDSRTLATAGRDRQVILWNVAERTPETVLAENAGPVLDLAFSPDGHRLATAAGHTVVLWDLGHRTIWATLTGRDVHDAIVSALEFSPDGRTLVAAAHDTSAWLWDTSPTRTARQICDRIARDLTPQEWRRLLPGVPRRQICKTD